MLSFVLGVASGAAGALPSLLLARRARQGKYASVALGLASIMGSFSLLTMLLGMGYLCLGGDFLFYACTTMGSFLALFGVEAYLAWRWMRPFSSRGVGA